MDPRQQFCPKMACPARGKIGKNNIVVHSRKEARYQCKICRKTFAATTGTPFYRLHHPLELMVTTNLGAADVPEGLRIQLLY